MKVDLRVLIGQIIISSAVLAAAVLADDELRIILTSALLIIAIIYIVLITSLIKKEADKTLNEAKEIKEGYANVQPTLTIEFEQLLSTISQILKDRNAMIPVLNNQLSSVIEQTDTAAMGLSKSFFNINKQAKSQLARVQSVFSSLSGEENGTGAFDKINSSIDELKESIDSLGEKIESSSQNAEKLTEKLPKVLSDEETIEDLQNFFEKVVRQKDEAQNLKSAIDVYAQSVSSLINDKLKESRREAEQLKTDAELLSKDVGNIIVSIQFQDITRQKIEHVIEPLKVFHDEMNRLIDKLSTMSDMGEHLNKDDVKEWLSKFYTMQSEKEIIEKTLSANK